MSDEIDVTVRSLIFARQILTRLGISHDADYKVEWVAEEVQRCIDGIAATSENLWAILTPDNKIVEHSLSKSAEDSWWKFVVHEPTREILQGQGFRAAKVQILEVAPEREWKDY